ncbi:PRMT5 arginine-N-methyltransferase [Trypanosoma melophagium]|uniref:PRMT5 arginine-N-methyltransferase n=1 Tax=Trypanosoma melophagium TaxID=715481 RepID=UPI00351A5418|nr:PRMT5 arginine-N-methyltransferase [Trypanosoma melophagium]
MEKDRVPGNEPPPTQSLPSNFEVCDQTNSSADEAVYSETSQGGISRVQGLQQYGIGGGPTLLSSLQQQEMCKASLFLFPLGKYKDGEDRNRSSCSAFSALVTNEERAGGSVERLWEYLSHTSSWGTTACGCVSASSWRTPSEVKSIQEQLRLAGFLGLRAVMVTLPETGDSDSDSDDSIKNNNNDDIYKSDGDSVFERALTVLMEHLRQFAVTNIWVRCDASCSSHRLLFSRLRTALMWGCAPPPPLSIAADTVAREAVQRVLPFLFFSQTFGALPSEWLGEPVVAFEVPSEERVRRALCANVNEGLHLHLPSDVIPLVASYWATAQPRFISLGSFFVELLRRRAIPVFALNHFTNVYTILNQLYEQTVMDGGKDTFAAFEDVLQLPLQPLGHMLPSGTYEVFERDRTKYQQYHAAMVSYFSDWLSHRKERSHALLCNQCSNGLQFIKTDCVYVVLVGAGRGPLIEECLSAASGVGLRVHLFAVEKNPEAVEFVRLRLRSDIRWSQWMNACGHVVEIIHADGRTISSAAAAAKRDKNFPIEWGLCDLVVSELLGSFGDNELSPECIDDFYTDLHQYQTSMGIPHNVYIRSIPQSYTAWIAPLYSAWMESSVAMAAVSGLTVLPSYCSDRRAALFHSTFVTNTTRAVSLSQPQACWTFRHFTPEEEKEQKEREGKEREAHLTFHLTSDGRCSGFIGYFSAVLFELDPSTNANHVGSVHISITLSTLYPGRTPNMFSWFPCVFALEPRDISEVSAGDLLHLHLRRCVNIEESRVWYSYDASIEHPEKDKKKEWEFEKEEEERKESTNSVKKATGIVNDKGWAASILLSF